MYEQIEREKKAQEESDQYNKFMEWQKNMWARLRENLLKKEIASRPKYIKLFDKAADKFLEEFNLNL